LDFSDQGRDVTVLFGDGAGAAVIEASPAPEYGILSNHLYTEGEHAEKLWIQSPGVATPKLIEKEYLDERLHFPAMEGRYVFKHAVTRVSECVQTALKANSVTVDDVDMFVFHQANRRINETVAEHLHIPANKTFHNIDKYGNCSAASIPICLSECIEQGLIKPGSLVCMAAFGSGFNWASSMVRW
jgi:3-oxoacyl-[acyl-carrier-protein] synthase-3